MLFPSESSTNKPANNESIHKLETKYHALYNIYIYDSFIEQYFESKLT
jgi:hypothetical protein